MSNIDCTIEIGPYWMEKEFGIVEPNPFETSFDHLAEHQAGKSRLVFEKFGHLGLGEKDFEITYPVIQHDGRNVCSYAYGGPYPKWDAKTASFWHDRSFVPWQNLSSVEDIKKIEVPDWNNVLMINQMIKKYEELKEQNNYKVPDTPSLPWNKFFTRLPSGKTYEFSHFMSFLDLGCFMCGETEFFTILASDEKIAYALLEKCFELSTSYAEFILKAYNQFDIRAISSFGGDNSCMLSPDMYKKYAMKFDCMLIEKYGNLPVNLHSCGPSAHLYDVWGEYTNLENIAVMQTRGIPGRLRQLRKSLPYTFLEITIHQPQFDFENESSDNIKSIVHEYIEDADGRDIRLIAVVNRAGPQTDKNIETLYKCLQEYEF